MLIGKDKIIEASKKTFYIPKIKLQENKIQNYRITQSQTQKDFHLSNNPFVIHPFSAEKNNSNFNDDKTEDFNKLILDQLKEDKYKINQNIGIVVEDSKSVSNIHKVHFGKNPKELEESKTHLIDPIIKTNPTENIQIYSCSAIKDKPKSKILSRNIPDIFNTTTKKEISNTLKSRKIITISQSKDPRYKFVSPLQNWKFDLNNQITKVF